MKYCHTGGHSPHCKKKMYVEVFYLNCGLIDFCFPIKMNKQTGCFIYIVPGPKIIHLVIITNELLLLFWFAYYS